MTNFKSGSGNLDFGSSDDDDEEAESTSETSRTQGERTDDAESTPPDESSSSSTNRESSEAVRSSEQSAEDSVSAGESTASSPSKETYPYFVRRSNVGDERDTRLEIHVRDKVANREAKFRNELAEHLGTNEVSKTDAREFALLAAFHDPKRVAELMREEGFGTIG